MVDLRDFLQWLGLGDCGLRVVHFSQKMHHNGFVEFELQIDEQERREHIIATVWQRLHKEICLGRSVDERCNVVHVQLVFGAIPQSLLMVASC